MTLRELNLEYWGRVHDMCEGTKVEPIDCLKVDDGFLIDKPPTFNYPESKQT